MKALRWLPWLVLVPVAYGVGRCSGNDGHGETRPAAGATPAAPVLWTCPMHPSIQLPDPGPCPICGMDLVVLEEGVGASNQLTMSEAGRALAEIRTEPVQRRPLTRHLRLSGKVEFDETRVRTLSAWVAGRIDRLFVDYTGIPVQRGDHLVTLYGPELLTAQRVLLEARRRMDSPDPGGNEFLENARQQAYVSAREKLLLWGLTREQVDEIERRDEAEDHIIIQSPISGVVITKSVNEGDYVATGKKIYEIADLSVLWVQLDVYEQDLPWVRYGQEARVEAEAFPGQVFHGRISFVSPTVEERTRTIKVRINIDNVSELLKPGMFVRATVQAPLAAAGQALDPALAGKWISPMHPEVVKDGPGQCDVCGMDLVPAESLGLVGVEEGEAPLAVPSSAVLRTGRRAVVYVQVPDPERIVYEGREVVLGPTAEGYVVVLSGVEEGELVVTRGAFKIDSSMQIQARPSMMSLADDSRFLGPQHAMFRASLLPLQEAYFGLCAALVNDDEAGAREMLEPLRLAFSLRNEAALEPKARRVWRPEQQRLERGLEELDAARDIEEQRAALDTLSRAMLAVERSFAHAGVSPHFEAYCPMAFNDQGASWMQRTPEIRNPYFGDRMLQCGMVQSTLPGVPAEVAVEGLGTHAYEPQAEDAADPAVSPARDSGDADPAVTPAPPEPSPEPRAAEGAAAIYEAYFDVQRALGQDDLEAAKEAGVTLSRRIQDSFAELAAVAQEPVMVLRGAVHRGRLAGDLGTARREFQLASDALLQLLDVAPPAPGRTYYEVFCPMAFQGEGARWLQDEREILNPYFGARMLRCGEVKAEHPAEDR